jgi:hypothetical protein
VPTPLLLLCVAASTVALLGLSPYFFGYQLI